MSEFEYIAVLISIVFGLAITQLLSGIVRLFYDDHIDDVSLGWALAVTLALLINWWSFFQWHDTEQWRFELYAFLVFWSASHYALSAALFPRGLVGRDEPERERKVFLVLLLVFMGVDVIEANLRDALFSPWYFLPSMASWALATMAVLVVRRRWVERLVAWYMFVSFIFFALIARSLLQA